MTVEAKQIDVERKTKVNRLEKELMSGKGNKTALRELARIDIAMASLQYDEMLTLHAAISAEIQPKKNAIIQANWRLDQVENDYREMHAIDKVAERETSGFIYGETVHSDAKYKNHIYSLGTQDQTSLASENETLVGSIIEKTHGERQFAPSK